MTKNHVHLAMAITVCLAFATLLTGIYLNGTVLGLITATYVASSAGAVLALTVMHYCTPQAKVVTVSVRH